MGRVILAFFLAVILALGLSIFSAWNWVDGQLNKQSWLTNKADTAGESWLILGSDEREGTVGDAGDVTGFRTDTILVLTKPKSGPSSLISIPRDSLVEIDQSYMKINAVAQLYNGKQLVNEVEDITGQKINHVAMVQFGGLVKVVDALGGATISSFGSTQHKELKQCNNRCDCCIHFITDCQMIRNSQRDPKA